MVSTAILYAKKTFWAKMEIVFFGFVVVKVNEEVVR